MGDVAIRVSGLGKQYRIGATQKPYSTLRDTIAGVISSTAQALRGSRVRPAHEIFWALKDVSFEVKRGEVLGIVGRNGAGKSTLLKILSRITEPTCGEVDLFGRVASLLEVGTGFHPELTGRENIYLNGAVLGMHRREVQRKFDEIVDFSGIEKFIDTAVKHYSSGMYMRLAFAVSAHLETEILLVDEVLAVGDAEFQKKCMGKMGSVASAGRTVVFVSHNMVAVQSLCQHAAWLDGGMLQAHGTASEIVTAYLRLGLAGESAAERIWPDIKTAPGNETVRLRRIAVAPETGKAGDMTTMQAPIYIEVEYWNLVPDLHLHTTLHVRNDQGIIAFTTGSPGDDPAKAIFDQPASGLFRSICHIPANLLNSGYHGVGLLFVRGSQADNFKLDDAIGFEVVDRADRNFAWFGREPGVLYPLLHWSTEYLGNDNS